jgi:hypothetical protein
MSTCLTKTARRAVFAASLVFPVPLATVAHADGPACAALAASVLPVPDWYAEECLGGAAVRDYARYREAAGLVPGDIAFYKNLFPSPTTVKTAPLATLNFTVVGPNTQPLFALAFDNTATTLYAVDNTTRQLGTLSLTTGAFTPIAAVSPFPPDAAVTGLAFDPTGTAAYLSGTNGFTSQLWTVNLTTGALTLVGPVTGFPFLVDIAIDRTGQMFGHDVALDALIRIDKATGAPTMVGPTGMNANFAQGMMYDDSDDTLYGCAFVILPAQQGQLVRFNTTTGAATIVAGPVPDELECDVRVATVDLTPVALAVDSGGNQVMEPNEPASMAPSWRNDAAVAQNNVTGALSAFTGPAGPLYTINDGTAAYGNIAAGSTATCSADCYALTAAAGTRPAQHWDTTVTETLSVPGQTKTWTLHIGGTFTDAPPANIFYRFIETIVHRDVTGGCTTTTYCPTASTTREQMAVFVLVSKEGAGYSPAACGAAPMFSDVPPSSPFCRWIEELARRGVVSGCGGGAYCPTASATREQMSVFVLRTLDPALNPPACVAGAEMFNDVPAGSGFCRWIEELARRGVVTGCGGGAYCPTAPVSREQMSVFLSATFGLILYGPN